MSLLSEMNHNLSIRKRTPLLIKELFETSSVFFFFFFFFFSYWLGWVFVAVLRLSLVVESEGYSLVMMCRLLIVIASLAAEHGF